MWRLFKLFFYTSVHIVKQYNVYIYGVVYLVDIAYMSKITGAMDKYLFKR